MSILIVGAGISGLISAITLLENGLPVRIINRNATHTVSHRASQVVPRSMEAHKFLGTFEPFEEASDEFPPVAIYKLPGGKEVVKEIIMGANWHDTPTVPFPRSRQLGQWKHEEMLRNHLNSKFNIEIEMETELLSLEQHTDHVSVTLRTSNGSEEKPEYAYLIGADGGRSVVRKSCKEITFVGEQRTDESFVIVDIFVKEGVSADKWHLWGDRVVQMAMMSISNKETGHAIMMMSGSKIDPKHLTASRENFIKSFYDFTGRTDIKFGNLISSSHYVPNIRMVNNFREGRVFLVGDAAHVHSPTGGQGLNSCIQDAINLGWKLALVQKGLSSDKLLDTYTDERLPVIREMLKRTTALLNREHIKNEDGTIDVSREFTRTADFTQLGVNYVGSSILLDEQQDVQDSKGTSSYDVDGSQFLRSGQRAPDAPGLLNVNDGKSTTLFDHFSVTYHTLLVFGADNNLLEKSKQIVEEYPAGLIKLVAVTSSTFQSANASSQFPVLEDKEGYAFGAYGVPSGGGKAVVIRPDGVIGAIVQSVAGIKTYLGKIL